MRRPVSDGMRLGSQLPLIAFDRQRMIGVRDAGVVDALEVCVDIARRARRFREAFDDRLANFLPARLERDEGRPAGRS